MATLAETAEDFLRFYLQGGAAAARAGTQLLPSSQQDLIDAALQRFDSAPATDAVSTIESDPFDVFMRTPGIARRIPAIAGPAPDFIAFPNPDLDRAVFTRAPDVLPDPDTLNIRGPIPLEDPTRPIQDDDSYVDMCAMEDAVVVAAADGSLDISFVWVQDYPAEALESASVSGASTVKEADAPRIRPLIDTAQPSVIVAECMEALYAFLGPDVFDANEFRPHLAFCGFEALDTTRTTIEGG